MLRDSESLPERNVQRHRPFANPVRRQRPPVHFHSQIDANRSHRRAIANPKTIGTAQLAEIYVINMQEHVARIHEGDRAEAASNRYPQLGVEDHQRVAADREPVGIERAHAIEGKSPDRRIATRIVAFASRQIVDDRGQGLAFLDDKARKPGRQGNENGAFRRVGEGGSTRSGWRR